jgi:hypothetical protein
VSECVDRDSMRGRDVFRSDDTDYRSRKLS